ncbi:MAG: carboxymuconolactone decarboxylase family protein [Deltaproteobacteria bacterium]|nr:carboxymuconolactone decarboxylase family protein [Deltaproteobacteria bacterium]
MRARRIAAALSAFAALAANAQDAKARLAPLPEAQWSAETRAQIARTLPQVSQLTGEAAPQPKPLPILTVIAYHPTLLGPFLDFATALAQRGVLSRRESELLALRAAWRSQSRFEWGHHAAYARTAGMSDEEIARVAEQGGASLAARELLLLRAADELHATHRFSDSTWAALRAEYTDAQLVEIPFLVGQYTMLSMVAEGLGVPVEPELPPVPPLR